MLPAGNKLEALYDTSKDKTQFDESLFPVFDVDIENKEPQSFNEIYWGVHYKYVNENENLRLSQAVVLGNVYCKVFKFL
ncbi:hypothetical protein CLV42_104317 [Chitinophaga ginsengisoli]|uniref:Uncharacterized protein n=1 Tax=Chitinophaga ginsengisoli TaxID=363837 RepID=A0A2P8GDG0_9BACT|nr:hypothetical protein CLV42_104317 [Chitinophaga ginsengisoli]